MKPHADQPKAPESKPTQDEVARKAYAIYLKGGRPQGHDVRNWLEAERKMTHAMKNKIMKTKNTVISTIIAVTQSKWTRPALMTLALSAAVLGVTSCKRSAPAESGAHAQQYTCTMHPKVVKDAPGDCPKCGMKLVEKR